jgi:DNA repair exonuclease SbcCD ATPase subunit
MADEPPRAVVDEADRLYGLPLEQFTAERDAAAKALRKAGDRDAAAVLAKLPKPTPAAWAANQVARTEPDVLDEFLSAGAALREAQEAALAGDAGALREATRAQRAAVEAFMTTAQPLQPGGRPLSRAMADRLRTTLLAAAGNEELSDALADGRLALEAEAGGAWPPPDSSSDVAAAPRRRAPAERRAPAKSSGRRVVSDTNKRAQRKAAKSAERDEAAEREREAQREAREAARREREELERQLREARGTLKVLQRALTSAEKDAARAEQRLQAAQAALEEAREEAESAAEALTEARESVDSTRDEVARLEERLD